MIFSRTLEPVKSLQHVTSHSAILQSISAFTPIPQKTILRSNEYFQILNPTTYSKNQTHKHHITIKTKGLLKPNLSLSQIYHLLNPFDHPIIQHKPITTTKGSPQSEMNFDSDDQPQQQFQQKQKQLGYGPGHHRQRKLSQSTNQMSNYSAVSVPYSGNTLFTRQHSQKLAHISCSDVENQAKIHRQQLLSLQRTNQLKQQKQRKPAKKQYSTKFSVFFLYFIKKITNSIWKSNLQMHQTHSYSTFYYKIRNFLINQLQAQPLHIVQILANLKDNDIYEYKLKETRTMTQHDINRLMNALKITKNISYLKDYKTHKYIEYTLLYQLYCCHDISTKLTQSYEKHVKSLKNTKADLVIYRVVMNYIKKILQIKPLYKCNIDNNKQKDNKQSKDNQQKKENKQNNDNTYNKDKKQNTANNNSNSNNNNNKQKSKHLWQSSVQEQVSKLYKDMQIILQELNKHYIQTNNQKDKLPPSKRIISMLIIDNLYTYHYQHSQRTQHIINKTQQLSLNQQSQHQPTYPHVYLQKLLENLVSTEEGLVNLQTQFNQVIFLYQLVNPYKIFNSPLQLIEKIFTAITEFSQFVHSTQDTQLVNKLPLLPISTQTLIWNPWKKTISIDKLSTFKLLFNVQNNPIEITSNLTSLNISLTNKSRESHLHNILHKLYYEHYTLPSQFSFTQIDDFVLKSLKMDQLKQKLRKTQAKTYLETIPYIKAIAVVYELLNKSTNNLIDEITEVFKKPTIKQNLLELMQLICYKKRDLDQEQIKLSVIQRQSSILQERQLLIEMISKYLENSNYVQIQANQSSIESNLQVLFSRIKEKFINKLIKTQEQLIYPTSNKNSQYDRFLQIVHKYTHIKQQQQNQLLISQSQRYHAITNKPNTYPFITYINHIIQLIRKDYQPQKVQHDLQLSK